MNLPIHIPIIQPIYSVAFTGNPHPTPSPCRHQHQFNDRPRIDVPPETHHVSFLITSSPHQPHISPMYLPSSLSMYLTHHPPLTHIHHHKLNPQQSPATLITKLNPPQLRLPKTPHFAIPPKAKIRTTPLNLHLPNQHAPTIPHVNSIPTPRVHVPKNIGFDPIRRACVRIRKYPAISEVGGFMFPENRVGVDGGGASVIGIAVTVDEVRVCDVDCVFVGGEAQAIWSSKSICYDSYIAGGRVEAVD